MAAILKLRPTPVIQRCVWNHLNNTCRSIATSKKNSDAAAPAATCDPTTSKDSKDWVSYGFNYKSKVDDTNDHHATFFFSITLCIVFGGFAWAYAPDVNMRDWAHREAFLELRRREKAGLPLIDPNYVSPKTIKLPAEKELCDIEIVI